MSLGPVYRCVLGSGLLDLSLVQPGPRGGLVRGFLCLSPTAGCKLGGDVAAFQGLGKACLSNRGSGHEGLDLGPNP